MTSTVMMVVTGLSEMSLLFYQTPQYHIPEGSSHRIRIWFSFEKVESCHKCESFDFVRVKIPVLHRSLWVFPSGTENFRFVETFCL
jgi:hypothetical protein